ncbi:MAG: preprotein translocase subunit YajC [Peptoniphilus sp.]|nr:preprotein translocase subunit YajC [Peptoniphilus sp.]MDD7363351.1 preprotein translocase subunit YajC [Bacillota bacterium]MDY6044270.1 preprotein translocase subunit YajC [Peptoniphilus sp.]
MKFGNGVFPLGAQTGANSMVPTLISIVLMIAIFYFGIIRPNKKKEKEAIKMMDNLAVGDVIQTIGGIIGKIVQVKADVIIIETTGMKTRLEMSKWAVKTVLKEAHRKAPKEDKEETKDTEEEKEEE